MTAPPLADRSSVQFVVLGGDAVTVASVRQALVEFGSAAIDDAGSAAGVVDPRMTVAVIVRPDEWTWHEVDRLGVPSIVVADAEPDGQALLEAVRHGVLGVVGAQTSEEELVGAARLVGAGEVVLEPSYLRTLLGAVRDTLAEPSAPVLTPRELDVLRTIEDGMSVKQTARELGISPRTVDNVQRFLFRKLGVRNRVQALARCHALGLLKGEGIR